MHNKYTVTLWFFDGYSTTRDLRDDSELNRYLTNGFLWRLVRSVQIIHNPHAES